MWLGVWLRRRLLWILERADDIFSLLPFLQRVWYAHFMRFKNIRLDKSCFEISNLNDKDSKNGWITKTHAERIEGLEILRQIWHPYDPDTARLSRIYTIIKR